MMCDASLRPILLIEDNPVDVDLTRGRSNVGVCSARWKLLGMVRTRWPG